MTASPTQPSPKGEGSWYDLSGRKIHQSSIINHQSSIKSGLNYGGASSGPTDARTKENSWSDVWNNE